MNITLENKVVLITGSSRGIGAAIAKKCAIEKAKVIINYYNNEEYALKLSKIVENLGGSNLIIRADVTNPSDVLKMKRIIIEKYGKIDVVINNAGSCSDNLCPVMPYNQWESIVHLNLDSVFIVSKIFSKVMIKQKYGKIINISSLKGVTGSRGQTNYSASKAGVIGFTKALAKELGDRKSVV